MSLSMRWLNLALFAGILLSGAIAPPVAAQPKVFRPPQPPPPPANFVRAATPLITPSVANQAINPNFRISPTLTLPQAAFNTAVAGQAISQIPAYAFGFNPYPQAVSINSGINPLLTSALNTGFGTNALNTSFGTNALNTGIGLGGIGVGGATLATSPYGGGGYGGGGYGGGGYGGYGSPYGGSYEDPYAGYLRGVASVTNADGNFLNQVQQARLLQTQADLSKLDLRRRIIEEAALERKNWLNPEAERIKDMEAAYTRATREPPITDVLSGQALNDLYKHVYPLQEKARLQGVTGPRVPLDEDMLKQVNLTGAYSPGSIGLLKDRGRLNWPLVLQSPEFDTPRKELSTLAADAVEQVRLNNPVGAATQRDLLADVRRMNDLLLRNVGEISPSEYVEGKRFLSSLESSIKALQDPNVGNQLNQSWTARAHTVSDLVDFMGQKGLRFAAATPGDEPAYRHVYQRLLAYDAAMSDTMAKK